jgi:glycosyltransferase involved in cell wall biosynthesis
MKNKKLNVILCANGDFAKPSNIGIRVYYIAKMLYSGNNLNKIICRSYVKNEIPENYYVKIFPFYKELTLLLKVINQTKFKNKFTYTLKPKIFNNSVVKNIDNKCNLIHCWDRGDKIFEKAKEKNIITIADLQQGIDPKAIKKNIDYYIVPSKFVYDQCLSKEKINKNKIFLVPFGVDSKLFKPKKNKKTNKKIKYLFVGAYEKRKEKV